jgi:hypothetical protein
MNIAVIYIDDVIIPGATFEQAADRLELVLQRLQKAGLKVKTKKCHLFKKSIQFLGHQVGEDGIRPLTAKICELRKWPIPKNVNMLRGFLRLAGYYRHMIKKFADTAEPLYRLLKKGVQFHWSYECQQAFDQLKDKLVGEPVMAFPKPEGKYILDTDASNVAVGAVLSQVQDGQECVIAYWSKAWSQS